MALACFARATGQVAAIEQLQELDGEFDVANAAVAGLDLAVAGRRNARLAARSAASAPWFR